MNMKKLFFLLCAFSLSGAAHGAGPEANIVPRPASVVPGEGTFTVTASTVIGTAGTPSCVASPTSLPKPSNRRSEAA